MEHIFELEDKENYLLALNEYERMYVSGHDFQLWKYYYFFVWYINVESFPLGLDIFIRDHGISKKLKELATYGIEQYKTNPEALFVLGYTIGLFPYLYGNYAECQEMANEMLKSATILSPDDSIHRIVSLGKGWNNAELYFELLERASSEIESRFEGKGLFNEYFRSVFAQKLFK